MNVLELLTDISVLDYPGGHKMYFSSFIFIMLYLGIQANVAIIYSPSIEK